MKTSNKKDTDFLQINPEAVPEPEKVDEKPSYAVMPTENKELLAGIQSDDSITSDDSEPESIEIIPTGNLPTIESPRNPENTFKWPNQCGNIENFEQFLACKNSHGLVGKVMKYEPGKMTFLVSFYDELDPFKAVNEDDLETRFLFEDQTEIPDGSWIIIDQVDWKSKFYFKC